MEESRVAPRDIVRRLHAELQGALQARLAESAESLDDRSCDMKLRAAVHARERLLAGEQPIGKPTSYDDVGVVRQRQLHVFSAPDEVAYNLFVEQRAGGVASSSEGPVIEASSTAGSVHHLPPAVLHLLNQTLGGARASSGLTLSWICLFAMCS